MICRGHRAEAGIIDWIDCNTEVLNNEINEAIKPLVLTDKCANCEYTKIGIMYQEEIKDDKS